MRQLEVPVTQHRRERRRLVHQVHHREVAPQRIAKNKLGQPRLQHQPEQHPAQREDRDAARRNPWQPARPPARRRQQHAQQPDFQHQRIRRRLRKKVPRRRERQEQQPGGEHRPPWPEVQHHRHRCRQAQPGQGRDHARRGTDPEQARRPQESLHRIAALFQHRRQEVVRGREARRAHQRLALVDDAGKHQDIHQPHAPQQNPAGPQVGRRTLDCRKVLEPCPSLAEQARDHAGGSSGHRAPLFGVGPQLAISSADSPTANGRESTKRRQHLPSGFASIRG